MRPYSFSMLIIDGSFHRPSVWFLINCMLYFVAASGTGMSEASSEFQKVTSGSYDKMVRPYADGGAVNVSVQVSIVALGPIDEKTLTYDIDIFLRHYWKDPRITFNSTRSLTYSGNPGEFMWIPDTYFPNARSVKTYRALTESIRATISPNGDIYVSSRMLATCSCKMNLQLYPMDTQKCHLLLESYSYSGKEIMYSWMTTKPPIEIVEGGLQVSGYEVLDIGTKEIRRSYTTAEVFSLLELSILIKRTFSYYLYRAYLPSSLLVILTWGTFWIPETAVPARVTMIVTNFLSTIFILNSAGSQITKVPYNTAMEVYLSTNAFFIILVLLEYLLVLNLDRKEILKSKNADDLNDNALQLTLCSTDKGNDEPLMGATKNGKLRKTRSHNIFIQTLVKYPVDSVAKVFFPLIYVVFLASYFLYYIT